MASSFTPPPRPVGTLRSGVDAEGFERVMLFTPAYDHREVSDGRYGQHVADFFFGIAGPLGAVSIRVFSGWDHALPMRETPNPVVYGQGAGISWHRRVHDDDTPSEPCEFCGRCENANTSFTGGDEPFRVLVTEGLEALWALLRAEYDKYDWSVSSAD